jgi:hypothetical protein
MKLNYLISFLFGSALVLGLISEAKAIIIRNDRTSADYEKLAQDYPSVGKLIVNAGGQRLCTGTLIDPRWVLTASHCLKPGSSVPDITSGSFTLGTSEYTVDGVYVNPGWLETKANLFEGEDIGLVKLSTPVTGIKPSQLFLDTNKSGVLGTTGTMVGFGNTGTAATGQQENTYGTKRAGTNVIDGFGTDVNKLYTDGIMLHDFDAPDGSINSLGSATATPLEFTGGISDSGGGWFIGGKLAGVNTGRIYVNGQKQEAKYGSISAITRVGYGDNLNWINSTIAGTAPKLVEEPVDTTIDPTIAGQTGESLTILASDTSPVADSSRAVPEPSSILAILVTGGLLSLFRRDRADR